MDRREGRVLGGLATVCRLVVGVGKDTATSAGIDFARTPQQGKAGAPTAEVALCLCNAMCEHCER
jgi:hypothetical protein